MSGKGKRKAERDEVGPPAGRPRTNPDIWYLRMCCPETGDDDEDLHETVDEDDGQPPPLPNLPPSAELRTDSPPRGDPPPLLPTILKTIMSGTIADLLPLSEGLTDWILDIARLAFGPYATGRLYCHRVGDADQWTNRKMVLSEWNEVHPGDVMAAKVYEFVPDGQQDRSYLIEKRMLARTQSATTANDLEAKRSATTFHDDLEEREAHQCFISRLPAFSCHASHLIPKRLGDESIRDLVERFQVLLPEGGKSFESFSRYDPRLGLFAGLHVDGFINKFRMGFKGTNVVGQYRIHLFVKRELGGIQSIDSSIAGIPHLHDTLITLQSHSTTPLPLPEVFAWHYLHDIIDPDDDNLYPSRRFDKMLDAKLWAPMLKEKEKARIQAWNAGVTV